MSAHPPSPPEQPRNPPPQDLRAGDELEGRDGPRVASPPARGSAPPPPRPSAVPSGVVYAFQFTAVGVWVAYAALYFQSLGVSLGVIGLLAGIPSIVAIFAAPAWGLLADRLGDVRPPYLGGALW